MSDPNQPKASPDSQAEGPTKTFSLKLDGWMTELMKKDLDADEPPADPPAAEPVALPPDPAPGQPPKR
jgi:hypothetical protein